VRYLSVKNFTKHQHYKDRRPPWIKLHVEVLDDYAFSCLQDASKAHLMLLWVLASKLDNRIPYDLPFLTRKLGATSPVDVDELVLLGFIEVSQDDSRPLAGRKQTAMPETETETETDMRAKNSRADVDRVVQHYVSRHPKRRPGEKDRKLIARHLGTYTAAELCEAIDGNADDEWATRTGKHELSWTLRDNGQIDNYREKGTKALPEIRDGWFAEAGA
jgi:hypothetical protein